MTERAKKLISSMALSEHEGVLVYNPSNMFYLSGYTGEGLVLITNQVCAIVTDFRYTEQAENQSPDFQVHMVGSGRNHETIAGEIMATKLGTVVQMPMVMPVEPGYLTGFAGEFDGFSSAAVFTSGMMGVAFCGYVFDLAEDADVAAFITRVEENVDPRWNGCTEAEMTAIGAYENSVFLIMCQTKIPASISGKADILEPTVEAGSASEALWNEFKTLMASENAPTIAVDIATALSGSAFVGTVTEADWTIETEDFKYPVEGYNNAAIIAGEGKTVYVIQMDEGMDVSNWGSYYFDGINGSFGAYNMTILVMINVG